MDYLKISKFSEDDFDAIIEDIGGNRFSKDHSREKKSNCDYIFNESLIELKLIEESGVHVETKKAKLAKLFGNKPKTVIIAPELLSEKEQYQYYRILESPIKTALKTASKQLQESANNKPRIKIAIIINNGLSLMMPEEFEQVATKCASNDTSGIDILLIGGNYFFSDKFDSYTIFPLKELYLNGIYRSDIVDSIREGWNKFLYQYMTNQIIDVNLERNKEPLQDISFIIDGILYVKPPPKMGKSDFWRNGFRPREDSTGLVSCPPVATILPKLNIQSYQIAKDTIQDTWYLYENLNEYSKWVSDEINKNKSITRPLVSVIIPTEKANASSFQDLCSIAAQIFEYEISKLIDGAIEFTNKHQSLNYILLNCIEIGINKANDISYIKHINEYPGFEKQSSIIDGERLKFEYGLAIACAYCIKVGADCVYYLRDQTYKWV